MVFLYTLLEFANHYVLDVRSINASAGADTDGHFLGEVTSTGANVGDHAALGQPQRIQHLLRHLPLVALRRFEIE